MKTAPLSIEFANCLSDRVGSHGLAATDLQDAAPHLSDLTRQLDSTRGTGWERGRDLPFDPMRSEHLTAVKKLVRKLRDDAENLVVLGIGGSALGNIALQAALNPPTWNLMKRKHRPRGGGPRLFVLDNVDPELVGSVLDEVRRSDKRLRKTIINVISKSGETAETAAQFMIARDMLRKALGKGYAKNVVAVTDPAKGTMRSICEAEGYATLPVPEGVGGRFSVLSPVGLFSAAMCGIDINALLDGAAIMDKRCSNIDALKNPAAVIAWQLMEFARRGKNNHVMMPYSNALYLLADWYRQLWAESLGKRVNRNGDEVFAGATPIKALGTTDQHSQVQLYREGPNDKVFCLIEVGKFNQEVKVPRGLKVENQKYLEGSTLGTLINAEKRATEYALVESQRPNFTIRFPRITAHAVGQFIQMWEIVTAYAGLMLNIDAYDQPAVETGKVATFGLMGRSGYEDWREKVERALQPTEYVV